jgi:hypothetical protein
MSVTVTGMVIIALGLIAFVLSNKWLFALTVFFVPFTATSVINIGDLYTGSAIQPYMFLSVLFITRNLPSLIKSVLLFKIHTTKLTKYFYITFILFTFIAAMSLIMPIIIHGTSNGNVTGRLNENIPIEFTSRNITQYLYFLLGVLFSVFVSNYCSKMENFIFAINIFRYSILFIMAWGTMEFFLKKLSIPYPGQIFNNSVSGSTGGYLGVLDNGSSRIFSVAAEPSILAQNIVVYLPFLFVSIENKIYAFSKFKDYLLAIFTIFFTIMTTSSSGILSVFVMIVLFTLTKQQSLKKRVVNVMSLFVLLLIFIPFIYLLFKDIIDASILNKGDSYSAMERFSSITSGWNNFLTYPFLGVGWGAVTVNDFIVKILSNTGVIGLIPLVSSLYFIICQHLNLSPEASHKPIIRFLNRACILSFIVLLFNCEMAGFSFYFGVFWLILGFCMVNKSKLT